MSAADQLRSITPAGHERLRAQLEELVTARRPEVARRLRDARDGRGPDDNPDHAAGLEELARIERQIAVLRQTLALVKVVDYRADGRAGIGAHVRLRMPRGETLGCQLVGSAEADASRQRISIESPVGQAIAGRCAGDVVDVEAPGGTLRIEILEIESASDALAA